MIFSFQLRRPGTALSLGIIRYAHIPNGFAPQTELGYEGGIFDNFSLAVTPTGNIRNLCQNRTSNYNRSEDEQNWVVHNEQIDKCGCYDKKNHGILFNSLFYPQNKSHRVS